MVSYDFNHKGCLLIKEKKMRIKPLKYLLLVFVIVISDSSFICAKISPSFDCTKATTEVEKLICSDDELAKLDLTALCYFYDKLDCNNIKDKVDDLTCSDSELLKLYKQIQKKYFVYCMTISSDIDRINFYKE